MKVSDIMTHPAITVTSETTVGETAELMIGHRITGLPVVSAASEIVGIRRRDGGKFPAAGNFLQPAPEFMSFLHS
jgi:CBS-domain-containing membrane protein